MQLLLVVILTTYIIYVSSVPGGLGPESPYRHLLGNGLELSTSHWQKLPPHLQKLFVRMTYKNMFGGVKVCLTPYRADNVNNEVYNEILKYIR